MIERLEGHGLLYRPADHPADTTPRGLLTYARQIIAEAAAEAEEWLLDENASPWDLAVRDLAARSVIAWWTSGVGFVQESYPEAELVVVVEAPLPDLPPEPESPDTEPTPDSDLPKDATDQ